jgi:AcrR family transcriptional regulator
LHCRDFETDAQLPVVKFCCVRKTYPVPVRKRRIQPRGEKVVTRVLEVTLRELARVGFGALTVPDVAKLARVNKTSVYRRWPTKQKLVEAAMHHSVQASVSVPDSGSLAGDLAEVVRGFAAFLSSPEGQGTIRTVFADGNHPDMGSFARQRWARSGVGPLQAVLERAIARKEVKDVQQGSLLFFTIAGALMHRVFIERADADQDYQQRLLKLMTHGIAGGRR